MSSRVTFVPEKEAVGGDGQTIKVSKKQTKSAPGSPHLPSLNIVKEDGERLARRGSDTQALSLRRIWSPVTFSSVNKDAVGDDSSGPKGMIPRISVPSEDLSPSSSHCHPFAIGESAVGGDGSGPKGTKPHISVPSEDMLPSSSHVHPFTIGERRVAPHGRLAGTAHVTVCTPPIPSPFREVIIHKKDDGTEVRVYKTISRPIDMEQNPDEILAVEEEVWTDIPQDATSSVAVREAWANRPQDTRRSVKVRGVTTVRYLLCLLFMGSVFLICFISAIYLLYLAARPYGCKLETVQTSEELDHDYRKTRCYDYAAAYSFGGIILFSLSIMIAIANGHLWARGCRCWNSGRGRKKNIHRRPDTRRKDL